MFRKILIFSFFILIAYSTYYIYRDSFKAAYFQDDWFTIKISQLEDNKGILNFFIPRTDIIYYRPLGMQLPFYIFFKIFNINTIPFHLFSYFIHILNALLIYKIIKEISVNSIFSLLSSFLYSTSMVHYIPFYWLSTFPFVLGPFFAFLSIFYFIKYLKNNNKYFYLISLIFFLFGLFTNELVLVLPFIFININFFLSAKKLKTVFIYFFIAGVILVLRFYVFPPPTRGAYDVIVSTKIFNNIHSYILWSFNFAEEIKNQFINFFTLNNEFIKNFNRYVYIIIGSTIILTLILFIIPIITYIKESKKKLIKILIFGFVWFIVGLLPVLFFENHAFSYYLPISIVGIFSLFALLNKPVKNYTFNKKSFISYLYFIIIIFLWLMGSITTFEFNSKIHWAKRRSDTSKKIIENTLNNYKNYIPNIIILKSTEDNYYAMNNQDGMQVIFNTYTLSTLYSKNKK